jgi:hypothetical protein
VVRVVDSVRLEAVSPGSAEVLVRSGVGDRVLSIEVEPTARPPIPAKHHTEVDRIAGTEVLFVGHANMDGWDHTAVAKPGIARLVREFKARGHPVVYFVSQDYPFWYPEDREPDLAVVSEAQEHQIVVDAERVVFSGGDFTACTLTNTQMTLHGMLKAGERRALRTSQGEVGGLRAGELRAQRAHQDPARRTRHPPPGVACYATKVIETRESRARSR